MENSRSTLNKFTDNDMPNLDLVVLGALELLEGAALPKIPEGLKRPLVVGSGNASSTGRIIFRDIDAIFAEEGNYESYLETNGIDGAVVVSASGGKHAVGVGKRLSEFSFPRYLLTNNKNAKAAEFFPNENILVFPKNREPYTYNTSTYLSMILSKTGEDVGRISAFIEKEVTPKLRSPLDVFSAFTFIVPPQFTLLRNMFRTKFDELFGPYVNGRVFTSEEIKHAKTVVTSGEELFISLGVDNQSYGLTKNRLGFKLPESADYGAMIAIGYYIIGKIQAAHPPYFKNNIENYCKSASEIFGHEINPIVE